MSSMKGSQQRCRHCGSEEVKINRANDTIQCETCDRILEERFNDFRTATVLLDRDSPFPIVTQDGLSKYKFDEKQLDKDPFHSTGFITAFSQTNLQPMGAFALTARTFSGDFAELERIVGDLGLDAQANSKQGVGSGVGSKVGGEGEDATLKAIMAAYFQVQEVYDILDLDRDDCDEAIRSLNTFLDASGAGGRSLDNVHALAMASLVLSQKGNSRNTELAELSEASGVAARDIEEAILMIQKTHQTVKNTPSSSDPVACFMPSFCGSLGMCRALGMSSATEAIAIQIANNATKSGVCARRNPRSVAAAIIYLTFNLEDQKKTQTEICKVTGLTEVTLRKVYKELLAGHQHIIPQDYTPKVPVKRLLPMGGLASSSTTPSASTSSQGGGGMFGVGQAQAGSRSSEGNVGLRAGDSNATAQQQLVYQQLMQVMSQMDASNQGDGQAAAAGDFGQSAHQAFSQIAAMGQSAFPVPVSGGQHGGEHSQQMQAVVARQFQAMQQAQQQGTNKKGAGGGGL